MESDFSHCIHLGCFQHALWVMWYDLHKHTSHIFDTRWAKLHYGTAKDDTVWGWGWGWGVRWLNVCHSVPCIAWRCSACDSPPPAWTWSPAHAAGPPSSPHIAGPSGFAGPAPEWTGSCSGPGKVDGFVRRAEENRPVHKETNQSRGYRNIPADIQSGGLGHTANRRSVNEDIHFCPRRLHSTNATKLAPPVFMSSLGVGGLRCQPAWITELLYIIWWMNVFGVPKWSLCSEPVGIEPSCIITVHVLLLVVVHGATETVCSCLPWCPLFPGSLLEHDCHARPACREVSGGSQTQD